MASKGAGARQTVKKPQNMPCHRMQGNAFGKACLDIGMECVDRKSSAGNGRLFAKKTRIDIKEQCRVLISGTTHHYAIDMFELGANLAKCRKPTVEHYWHMGIVLL